MQKPTFFFRLMASLLTTLNELLLTPNQHEMHVHAHPPHGSVGLPVDADRGRFEFPRSLHDLIS